MLGVVIKCGNDSRVFDCLDSIQHPAQVAVSGFFSPELRQELRGRDVLVVDAPCGNLGLTTALGIQALTTEKVVIMDSDSWFGPGTAAAFASALDEHPFVKARIVYEAKVGLLGSHIVARTRQQLNDELARAYTPGLGLRRTIAQCVGGHLFDERIWFSEDAELDFRRRMAGLSLHYLQDHAVHHAPVHMLHDVRAAYRVGYGKAQQVQHTSRPNDEDPGPLLARALRLEHPRLLKHWVRNLAWAGAAHNVAWFSAYYTGYYVQRVLQAHR